MGCSPFTSSNLQNAKLISDNQTETTIFGTLSSGSSFGFQSALGLSDDINLRFRGEVCRTSFPKKVYPNNYKVYPNNYLYSIGFDTTIVKGEILDFLHTSFGFKYKLIEDGTFFSSLYMPFSVTTFLGNGFFSIKNFHPQLYILEPTVIFSVINNYFEITPSYKLMLPIKLLLPTSDSNYQILHSFNLCVGLSNKTNSWIVKQEVGYLSPLGGYLSPLGGHSRIFKTPDPSFYYSIGISFFNDIIL